MQGNTLTLLLSILVAASILLTQAGCIVCGLAAAGSAGAGFVSYKKGDLEVTEPISYEEAFTAVDATIQEMGMQLVKREKQPLVGEVKADSHFGKVTYNLKNKGDKLTYISIRVGTFGDAGFQGQIYSKLKSKYGGNPKIDPNTGLPTK